MDALLAQGDFIPRVIEIKPAADAHKQWRRGVENRLADVTVVDELVAAFRGCAAVIHCAGVVDAEAASLPHGGARWGSPGVAL